MACCLLMAALLTRVHEWMVRHGVLDERRVAGRTNLFPTRQTNTAPNPRVSP